MVIIVNEVVRLRGWIVEVERLFTIETGRLFGRVGKKAEDKVVQ